MDDFFSNIIPIIILISVIASIVNKSKKAKEKQTKSQQGNAKSPTSIREIILQQIEQQKKAIQPQATPVQKPVEQKKPMYSGGSLEGAPTEMQRHAHKGHLGGAYNEGDALNRSTLENTPTEMQRHTHEGHIGGAYNEGDELNRSTLEGMNQEGLASHDVFDNVDTEPDVSKVHRKVKRPRTGKLSGGYYKALKMNRSSIVNGIIMAEVLNKRGGRRRAG